MSGNKTAQNASPKTGSSPAGPMLIQRSIGKTAYTVEAHFSRTSGETMGDKISRLIKNEITGRWKRNEQK